MGKRDFKLSADISHDAKDKLTAICEKSERSRGQILERMINKFHAETFGKEKPKKEIKRFSAPTVEEVCSYMMVRNSTVNGQVESEKFFDFYSAKGWMVGKNKMKDWKAAVRNWLKGKSNETGKQATHASCNGAAVESVSAALEKQRAEFYSSSEAVGSNGSILHGQVDEAQRGDSIIDLDNGDWTSF